MAELVLHIGLPKTATTYLQHWLCHNRKQLAEHGVWAPSRTIIPHRLAVEAITNDSVRTRDDVTAIRKTDYATALAEVAEGLSDHRIETAAVSSEYFYEAEPRLVRSQLSDRLGVATRIIVVLRRQDRLIESGYNQSVKAMGTRDKFHVPGYLHTLDWYRLVGMWGETFGADRINVLNYENSRRRGTVLADFLACIDKRLAAVNLDAFSPPPRARNESLPADLLEFKRIANALGEFGLQHWLYRLIDEGHSGPEFRLPEEAARKVIALYQESNDRLAREVLNLDGPLFPDYGSEGEGEGVDLSGKLPIEALASVVAFHVKETMREIAELKKEIAALKAPRRSES